MIGRWWIRLVSNHVEVPIVSLSEKYYTLGLVVWWLPGMGANKTW